MSRTVCPYFLCAFMVNILCFCQKKPSYTPIEKSIFTTVIQDNFYPLLEQHSEIPAFQDLNTSIKTFLKNWEVKGASVAIIKDGRLVYIKSFGYADLEQKVEARPYHLFRIASVSKLFTAVAIMKLVEEGKLKLTDKVFGKKGILSDRQFLEIGDSLARKIELQHLLTHTGGFKNQLRRDPMFAPAAVAKIMKVKSPPSLEATIAFMLKQKGFFEPGTFFDYSNFGYATLGKIIEKVTGMSYERYMQDKILKPLGVTSMKIGKNSLKERFPIEVKYYTQKKEKLNVSIYGTGDSLSRAYEGTNTEGLGAAGAWIASAVDLAKFLVAIDGFQSKKDILSRESIAKMIEIAPDDSLGKVAIGWKQIDDEKWWRTGSLASTNAVLTRRQDGLAWVFVTNSGTYRGPYFSYEIEGLMKRQVLKIKKFPTWDWFEVL